MKLFIAAATLSVSYGGFANQTPNGRAAAAVQHLDHNEKRYNQLVSMMGHFNKDFEEKKFWTYGCNCMMLGDRPMSDMGHGQAVDEIDKTCKRYKECLKCARARHNDDCIGESSKYSWKVGDANGDGIADEVLCNNQKDSCKRAICECDKMFAEDHSKVADEYTNDYHLFYTTTGWNYEENCVHGTTHANSECCGVDGSPSFMYNTDHKYCCAGAVSATSCGY